MVTFWQSIKTKNVTLAFTVQVLYQVIKEKRVLIGVQVYQQY